MLQMAPDDARAHERRGFAYVAQGDLERAAADYAAAVRLNGDHHLRFWNQHALLRLQVKDQAGNVTNCDPTTTTVVREPRGQTLSGIDGSEHFLTIQNGTPGLKSLVARVNGTTFAAHNSKPGEKRTIDISSALKTGDTNAVQLIGHGPGAADVLIWDGAGTA